MKKLINISLMILAIIGFSITTNFTQVAPENSLKIEAVSSGLASGWNKLQKYYMPGHTLEDQLLMVQAGSITIFAESGYGCTKL